MNRRTALIATGLLLAASFAGCCHNKNRCYQSACSYQPSGISGVKSQWGDAPADQPMEAPAAPAPYDDPPEPRDPAAPDAPEEPADATQREARPIETPSLLVVPR